MLVKTVTKGRGTKKACYKSHREKAFFGTDNEKSIFRSNMGRLGDEDEDLKK